MKETSHRLSTTDRFSRYNINSDSFTKLDANLTFPSPAIDAKWVAGVVLTNDTIC